MTCDLHDVVPAGLGLEENGLGLRHKLNIFYKNENCRNAIALTQGSRTVFSQGA